jgi:putative colanic acid biosynthesis acetyltransferase WcaF
MTSTISKVKLSDFNPKQGLNRRSGKIKEIIWYLVKIFFFLSAFPFPTRFKVAILKFFGAIIGEGVVIKPRVNIHFPWKLIVGNNVWIGEEAFLLNFEMLLIGDNVCISQRAFLCGGNHDYKTMSMPYRNGPITLEDGSWVGACCFVGPGVIIGVDSVITAQSVVTKTIPANCIYGGNPIKFLKKRW